MNDFHDNRLEEDLDATLHLLDRQIVDSEGAMVGKVDDVELTEDHHGALRVTGLLTGPAALVPRLGGDHDQKTLFWWRQLNPVRAERTVPGCIGRARRPNGCGMPPRRSPRGWGRPDAWRGRPSGGSRAGVSTRTSR